MRAVVNYAWSGGASVWNGVTGLFGANSNTTEPSCPRADSNTTEPSCPVADSSANKTNATSNRQPAAAPAPVTPAISFTDRIFHRTKTPVADSNTTSVVNKTATSRVNSTATSGANSNANAAVLVARSRLSSHFPPPPTADGCPDVWGPEPMARHWEEEIEACDRCCSRNFTLTDCATATKHGTLIRAKNLGRGAYAIGNGIKAIFRASVCSLPACGCACLKSLRACCSNDQEHDFEAGFAKMVAVGTCCSIPVSAYGVGVELGKLLVGTTLPEIASSCGQHKHELREAHETALKTAKEAVAEAEGAHNNALEEKAEAEARPMSSQTNDWLNERVQYTETALTRANNRLTAAENAANQAYAAIAAQAPADQSMT